MKKKNLVVRFLSVFCAFSLMAVLLTSCTTEEMGFLDLIKERNSFSQYRIDGIFGANKNTTSKYYSGDTDVRYTVEVNDDADYKHITINGMFDGVEFTEPFDYYVSGNKYYINKNIMRYNNAKSLHENDRLNYSYNIYNDVSYLLDELDNTVLKDTDYVMIDLIGNDQKIVITDFIPTTKMFTAINNSQFDMDKIPGADYEIIDNYLRESYSGFESEMITEIPNGYKLEFGPERLEDTLINLSDYTYLHREEIYNSLIYYTNMFFDSIPCPDEETLQIVENLRAKNVYDKERFMEFTESLHNQYNYDSKGTRSNNQNGGYLSYSISKEDSAYKTVQRILEVYTQNETTLTEQVYHEKNQTAAEITPELPQNYIAGDEYNTTYTETQKRINPCIAIEINGYVTNGNYVRPCMYDENGNVILNRIPIFMKSYKIYKNSDVERLNLNALFENNNGSICVKLRNIAEALDETVVWDTNTQTASIQHGDELIPFDGVLFSLNSGYTMGYITPVREFEKLGYKIEYIETINDYNKSIKINIIKP